MTETIKSIITSAESMLDSAKFGLILLSDFPPNQHPTGVRNVLTYGKAITPILHRLRKYVDNYDEWYSFFREEMETDPLMKYMYILRNDVLKEGKMPVSSGTDITYFSSEMLDKPPKPKNIKSFFMGDQFGGSGWEVYLPDGSIEKIYINLPWDSVKVSSFFDNLPKTHLGRDINGYSLLQVCSLYLSYLDRMLEGAKHTFLAK